MNESLRLQDATAQDIQLELIRRTEFNSFDGAVIYHSLMKNRELWQAVVLDRPGYFNAEMHRLSCSGLIKLRDLSDNFWNADVLFILTESRMMAQRLVEVAESDGWSADEMTVIDDVNEIINAMGTNEPCAIVKMWWD